MNKIVFIRWLTIVSVVLLVTAVLLIRYGHKQLNTPLNITNAQLITVNSGSSLYRFSKQLQQQGWINNRFWLRAYARIYPEKVALKVGTYQAVVGDTPLSLLNKIQTGVEYHESLTFVEGSTLKDWLGQLSTQPHIIKTPITDNIEALAQHLGISQSNPEGWFFPDTYAYTLGTKDIDILKRAHNKMQQVLTSLWEKRQVGLPYETPYQALIMASIIEKETGIVAEQPTIASVFVNRLAKNMRLQTDPTVIYGLGDKYQGNITRAHLKEKTAYNTYRINGFPPTPIAMPGISAIEAALQPDDTDLYYFVSKGDGSHYFSASLAEHNKAVKKYQLGQQ
ncbi:endolytic transglycosylase MltG [Colwellia sp. MEBiC06753]